MREQRTIEVLEALVGFDTTSRNSNLALVEWVEAHLDRFGVAHERVPDKTGRKANVWATIGPSGVPGTILSGHTDVVPVEGQSWSNDPFRLTARNGRLYGRGATDMKGFDACCLAAVPDMVAAPLTRPIHLALSYDEEVGCIGVRGMIARLKRAEMKPAACFVGEPTEMDGGDRAQGQALVPRHRAWQDLSFVARAARGECGRICRAPDHENPRHPRPPGTLRRARSAL